MPSAANAGAMLGDCIIQTVHLMYQQDTATRYLNALIERLKLGKREFGPDKKEPDNA